MMENKSVRAQDNWWKVHTFIDGFNKRQVDALDRSIMYILDESMSPMVPR